MRKGLHLPVKVLIFLAVFSLASVRAEAWLPDSLFTVNLTASRPDIRFRVPENCKLKLLNESPAQKILLKLSLPPDEELPWQLLERQNFPPACGIRSVRSLPLNGDARLIIFELNENNDFYLEGNGRIVFGRKDAPDAADNSYAENTAHPQISEPPQNSLDNSSASALDSEAEVSISQQDPVSGRSSTFSSLLAAVPLKARIYFGGIVLMSVFIIFSLVRYWTRKERRKRRQFEKMTAAAEKWQQKQAKEVKKPNSAPADLKSVSQAAAKPGPQGAIKETTVRHLNEKSPAVKSAIKQEIAPGRIKTESEKADLARRLNLGIGEIELAINLTSRQRAAQNNRTIENQINALSALDLSYSEIARRMGIGQEEVRLFLSLKQSKESERPAAGNEPVRR
ncbi:MAG: hypothetical protein WAN36_12515 [Calditrichia bacterium]